MQRIPLKNIVWSWLAVQWGRHFSLDAKLRKTGATARIAFVEGMDTLGGSITVKIEGTTYFFEGTPEIEEFENGMGKKVRAKTLKYGGWEMDMTHPKNKMLF